MQVELCCNQMNQLAQMIAEEVNNPHVESSGCAQLGDQTELANFIADSAAYGGTWSAVYVISSSSGEADVTVSPDIISMVPNTNKSEWWAPVLAALATFDGWGQATVVVDTAVTVNGGKPTWTIPYSGPANAWINIHRTVPSGEEEDIKFSVDSAGAMTIEGTDVFGPFGTPAQVPC